MTDQIPEDEYACGFCKFALRFFDGKGNVIYMECRRFPPTAILVFAHPESGRMGHTKLRAFPNVQERDWCWEFQKKEAA